MFVKLKPRTKLFFKASLILSTTAPVEKYSVHINNLFSVVIFTSVSYGITC